MAPHARVVASQGAPLTFVEVALHGTVGDPTTRRHEIVQIVLAAGDVPRIEGAVDTDAVRTVLAVLRGRRAS